MPRRLRGVLGQAETLSHLGDRAPAGKRLENNHEGCPVAVVPVDLALHRVASGGFFRPRPGRPGTAAR